MEQVQTNFSSFGNGCFQSSGQRRSLTNPYHRPFCWAPTEAPTVPEVPLLRRLVERTLEGQKGLLETRRICLAKDQRALRYMKFHQHLLTLP